MHFLRSQALRGNAMPAGFACIPLNALPGVRGGASPAGCSQAEPGNEEESFPSAIANPKNASVGGT